MRLQLVWRIGRGQSEQCSGAHGGNSTLSMAGNMLESEVRNHQRSSRHHRIGMSKKKVLIVGAGAAGTACAWALSQGAEMQKKWEVHLWDAAERAGGMATSETLQITSTMQGSSAAVESDTSGKSRLGTHLTEEWINDGVQGGSSSYHNTMNLLRLHGFDVTPVKMKVSFGRGGHQWSNYTETEIIRRLRPEIQRFGKTLRTIRRFEPLLGPVPIARLLRLFRYSNDFCNFIVFPLVALFFGTGNQTPHVSSALFARVFTDEDLRLFDYDPERFLSQEADMFAFPNLRKWYEAVVAGVRDRGATVCFGRAAAKVDRSTSGVTVTDCAGQVEHFDEIVLACDAETCLKILGDSSTWRERSVLKNVQYFDDVTVTHIDENYMQKYYQLDLDRGKDAPMYFISVDEENPRKIEMSFNLTKYQPHLARSQATTEGNAPASSSSAANIYQTIFLNKMDSDQWRKDEIDPGKVLLTKWWHQFSHRWQHFVFTVPWTRLLQGRNHTWFCGSWLLVNTHEIAIISGMSVAYRLGAKYPFDYDELAAKQFDQFLQLCHGTKRRKTQAKESPKEPFVVNDRAEQ